jgi:uncharacterized damage-inducible protein DinB
MIAAGLLPELDHESAITRTYLLATPEDRYGWRPSAKSMTMGMLVGHLAEALEWGRDTVNTTGFDMDPAAYRPFVPATRDEAVRAFDTNLAAFRAALAGASDADLAVVWTMLVRGTVVMQMPRIAVLRGMILNHSIHHRAQLGVYLRLLDLPVPSAYGPTADTPNPFA